MRSRGARDTVAAWVGATPAETIFTSNATAAINTVAYAWGHANLMPGDTIVLTEMEHHSNIVPWQIVAERAGAQIAWARVTDEGRLDLDHLGELLTTHPRLLAFTHVSNVLGTINPVAEIAAMAREKGVTTVVDGSQAAPHLPIDVRALGADFYAFTGHKMYGPTGIGVLVGRRELLEAMPPFIGGGHMIKTVGEQSSTWNELPWKFEAGTSPIVEAVGLGEAVAFLREIGLEQLAGHEAQLVGYMLQRLAEVPGLTVFGPGPEHRAGVVSFTLDGVHPHDVAELLGRDEVCIRAGHHCAQPLMRRLGVQATSRASVAVHNSHEDIDRLVAGLHGVREVFQLD